jgi:hypothetical protein
MVAQFIFFLIPFNTLKRLAAHLHAIHHPYRIDYLTKRNQSLKFFTVFRNRFFTDISN